MNILLQLYYYDYIIMISLSTNFYRNVYKNSQNTQSHIHI